MLASGPDATVERVGRSRYALVGCVCGLCNMIGCAVYHPRPLNPPQLENEYRSRTLDDRRLHSFIQADVGPQLPAWPPKVLDLSTLTLIGYYYSPDLEIARAQIAIADAGVRTAGARINPTLGIDAGYNRNPESAPIYSVLPS